MADPVRVRIPERHHEIATLLRGFVAAPREPAQAEPAAGVDARAAGFAEGVEAAAEIADGFLLRGPDIAAAIRSMPLPAAPDALLPGLRAAWRAADNTMRFSAYRAWLDAEIARLERENARITAEIARRGA